MLFLMWAIFACLSSAVPATARSAAIIGGVEVETGDPIALSTVAVRRAGELCSGSLIGDHLVITAAHCLKEHHDSWITFGLKTGEGLGNKRWVSDFEIHPEYVSLKEVRKNRRQCQKKCDRDPACRSKCVRYVNTNDLALLYFREPAPDGYRPAQIEWDRLALLGQPSLVVAGFGRTSRYARGKKVFSLKKTSLKLLVPGPEAVLQQDTDNAVCKGDSGGPAFLQRGSEFYLVGVASRGDSQCRERQIYGLFSMHRDWIEQAIDRLLNRAGKSK